MSLSEVIARIPPVTRTFLASAIFSGLAVRFRLLSPYSLALLLPKHPAQVWRYATNFMYFGSPDFSWLFRLYFMYVSLRPRGVSIRAHACHALIGQLRAHSKRATSVAHHTHTHTKNRVA